MIHPGIDTWSDQAADRYGAFLRELSMAYVNAIVDPVGLTPLRMRRALDEGRAAMYRLQGDFRARSAEQTDQVAKRVTERHPFATSDEIAEDAMAMTHALASSSYDYLISQIDAQAARDFAELGRTLRSAKINIRSRRLGLSQTENAARMDLLMEKSGPKFIFRDRIGRPVGALIFVRAVWRQALRGLHNDTVAMVSRMHGQTSVSVVRDDKTVETLRLDGHEPDYESRRDALFHPNTRARLDWPEAHNVHA